MLIDVSASLYGAKDVLELVKAKEALNHYIDLILCPFAPSCVFFVRMMLLQYYMAQCSWPMLDYGSIIVVLGAGQIRFQRCCVW